MIEDWLETMRRKKSMYKNKSKSNFIKLDIASTRYSRYFPYYNKCSADCLSYIDLELRKIYNKVYNMRDFFTVYPEYPRNIPYSEFFSRFIDSDAINVDRSDEDIRNISRTLISRVNLRQIYTLPGLVKTIGAENNFDLLRSGYDIVSCLENKKLYIEEKIAEKNSSSVIEDSDDYQSDSYRHRYYHDDGFGPDMGFDDTRISEPGYVYIGT